MKSAAMTLSDLRLELGKDIDLLTVQDMASLFGKGVSKDFPKIRKMRRRLIAESLLIICATSAAALMSGIVSDGNPIAILFMCFAVLFAATEILGFHYVWHLPSAVNLKGSLKRDHRRMQIISRGMKILNLGLGFILLAIVLIDSNVTNQIPVSALLTMFAVKIMAWLLSIKWMIRARQVRFALKEFDED